jgi:hypothetical protein
MLQDRLSDKHDLAPDFCDWKTWNLDAYSTHPFRRKTGWMRAEAAGDPGPWRQQAILGRGDWDADALRGFRSPQKKATVVLGPVVNYHRCVGR